MFNAGGLGKGTFEADHWTCYIAKPPSTASYCMIHRKLKCLNISIIMHVSAVQLSLLGMRCELKNGAALVGCVLHVEREPLSCDMGEMKLDTRGRPDAPRML
jgi:hypothetical protein